ncbi:hypothetical protein PpBr36_02291 [Pyricularia pennisetigena]|uniref:hypothetical protein n=1 Tax=Pyricularia pennisetigena TaxID=1578925 RepID=UPI001151943B|nr:hypothetical protein PpBr36_02291 [Pyricularia pennisetigena]TLS31091.1 hypothetical protein PpBr36_02291 [Pyricularia pennisetigena]
MDPNAGIPTLNNIEKGHFGGEILKNISFWNKPFHPIIPYRVEKKFTTIKIGIPIIIWGEKFKVNPNNSLTVSVYQINRYTGGLVLVVQVYYYVLDAIGFKNYIIQLAANYIDKLLNKMAFIRDKNIINLRLNSYPPINIFVINHRPTDVNNFNFGFGKPIIYRYLFGGFSTENAIIIYPPVKYTNPDEGCVFSVIMEKKFVGKMIKMREFCDFFEYRGVN